MVGAFCHFLRHFWRVVTTECCLHTLADTLTYTHRDSQTKSICRLPKIIQTERLRNNCAWRERAPQAAKGKCLNSLLSVFFSQSLSRKAGVSNGADRRLISNNVCNANSTRKWVNHHPKVEQNRKWTASPRTQTRQTTATHTEPQSKLRSLAQPSSLHLKLHLKTIWTLSLPFVLPVKKP